AIVTSLDAKGVLPTIVGPPNFFWKELLSRGYFTASLHSLSWFLFTAQPQASDRARGACNEDAHRLSPLSSQPACRYSAARRPSLIQASNCALSWLTNRCPGRRLRSAPGRRAARYPTSRFHGGARSAARARSCEWLPPTDRGPRSSRQSSRDVRST